MIRKTGLRPIRSPIEPKIAAPIGRTTMPAPKVAKLANNPELGSVDGKNNGPNMTAKVAKVKKSYHSKNVPKQAESAIFRYEIELSILLILFNLLAKRLKFVAKQQKCLDLSYVFSYSSMVQCNNTQFF